MPDDLFGITIVSKTRWLLLSLVTVTWASLATSAAEPVSVSPLITSDPPAAASGEILNALPSAGTCDFKIVAASSEKPTLMNACGSKLSSIVAVTGKPRLTAGLPERLPSTKPAGMVSTTSLWLPATKLPPAPRSTRDVVVV